MTQRRSFLKTGAAAITLNLDAAATPPTPILRQARAHILQGGLGHIVFCRVSHERFLPALRFVLEDARAQCLVEVDRSAPGMSVLGSAATLRVTNTACRLYPAGA